MEIKLKPEMQQHKVILRNPTVVKYVWDNCKALKCSPDEFILKLINNMSFLQKLKRYD